MKAQAPSINLIKAQIETEIAPIVGNEQQAEDLIRYIRENAGKGEEGIWETNIFGKSIAQIVDDGIQAKISQLTEDCQVKLQDTLQKIINDSNGGDDLYYYIIEWVWLLLGKWCVVWNGNVGQNKVIL